MLSIFAPHFFNWTEQLKNSGHEVYWLDIYDSNTRVEKLDFAEQILGWRYKWDFPGRYFLKSKTPEINRIVNFFNERNFQKQLEKQIRRIQPDLVHSFVMYLGGVPALPVMKNFPGLKWAYTAWGSDMYFYQNRSEHLKGMEETLPQMDYMFADCQRDHEIARQHGFEGKFLGVFPGRGGFDFKTMDSFLKNNVDRNVILIKGYQGIHGKCISVLKAVEVLKEELEDYQIVVFGAQPEVLEFVNSSSLKEFENLKLLGKVAHREIIKLMGSSIIYIGNSSSDGMPNTLLEAIVMQVFPIQSNPGGVTEELITHKKNGFLIESPENHQNIKTLLKEALNDPLFRKEAITWNTQHIRPQLERGKVKEKVLQAYRCIELGL